MGTSGPTAAVLVGRKTELGMGEGALERAAAGRSACLALVGEPGIGKTALLADLCRRAGERGFDVALGGATEFEQEVPFAPIVAALDERLGRAEPNWLEQLGESWGAELGFVFPALAGRGGQPTNSLQAERYRAHWAVRAALETLAVERPLILALDDLHWADRASLELVAHLIHRPPARVFVAMAYRDRPSLGPLAGAVSAAERAGTAETARLEPLSEEDAGAMLAGGMAPDARRTLYRESGGNPFYLKELVRAVNAGAIAVDGLAGSAAEQAGREEVPGSVRTTVGMELEGCSPDGRAVAQAAAVLGEPFDPAVVARVAQVDESRALTAIDELAAVALVRATEVPRHFAFRHPMVRRAVYEACSDGARLSLHARSADALEALGAPLSVWAHHLERSAAAGDTRAITALAEAGHTAAPRAPAAAARWFAGALRLLPDDAPARQRLDLLLPLTEALAASNQVGATQEALAEALELTSDQQPLRRAQLIAAQARLANMNARRTDGRALEQALAAAREPALVAALTLQRAIDGTTTNDADALSWARRAHELTQALGDPGLHAAATAHLAHAELWQGKMDTARRQADEAAALIDGLTDAQLAERVEGPIMLGQVEGRLERFAAAAAHLERSLSIVRATGQSGWFIAAMTLLANTELDRGRLVEASAAIDAALASSGLGGQADETRHRVMIAFQARLNRLRGEPTLAVALTEAVASGRDDPAEFMYGWLIGCERGAALIATGQPEQGRQEILAVAGVERGSLDPGWRVEWCRPLAEAEVALGDLDAASAWVARAEAEAAASGLEGRVGAARHAGAVVALAAGDHDRALGLVREAEACYSAVGRVLDWATAGMLEGEVLLARDDPGGAAAVFERAHGQLAECGAERLRNAAARELRRLGRRATRPVGADGLSALSDGELEVARLVTEGVTNREIAARLFLSERTIERRLSNVFDKLGVNSRTDVARIVAGAS